jgi:hypothetical protein
MMKQKYEKLRLQWKEKEETPHNNGVKNEKL